MTNEFPPRRIWVLGLSCGDKVWVSDDTKAIYDAEDIESEAAYIRADVSEAEGDEAYQIGKHEGYEDAVQAIDIATGGDGEYKGSTIPGETVDSDVMQARIIERCKRADEADQALAALKEGRRALGVAVKHAGGDPNTHIVCKQMAEAIVKLEGAGK